MLDMVLLGVLELELELVLLVLFSVTWAPCSGKFRGIWTEMLRGTTIALSSHAMSIPNSLVTRSVKNR